MTETKMCMCCGFQSDNYRLFIKPPFSRLFNRKDDWICRSEASCRERTGT